MAGAPPSNTDLDLSYVYGIPHFKYSYVRLQGDRYTWVSLVEVHICIAESKFQAIHMYVMSLCTDDEWIYAYVCVI